MKKFKFKLEKILEYKKMVEHKKQLELARHISDFNKAELEMEEARKTKVQIIKKIKESFENITYVQLAKNALKGVDQTIINNTKKQHEIQKRIDFARQEYIKAKQDREAFDKLKEKAHSQHKYLEKKELEKIMEESSIRLWNEGKIREFEAT